MGLLGLSTTLPYKERLNAGISPLALGMDDHLRAADFTGGLKAGTTALISALESVEPGRTKHLIVSAADYRLGRPASGEEMIFGDAAAAFMVDNEDVIAEFKGSYSLTYDFGDHFRGEFAKYDRKWEDRWVRDVGFDAFIPMVIRGFFDRYGMKITDFKKVIYDCHYAAERNKLNKILGIPAEMEQSNLQAEVGQCGTAQPLLMLANALDTAEPGDKLLVVSFGSGCDAMYFEVTDNIRRKSKPQALPAAWPTAPTWTSTRSTWSGVISCPPRRDFGAKRTSGRAGRCSGGKDARSWGSGVPAARHAAHRNIRPNGSASTPSAGPLTRWKSTSFSDKPGRILSYTGDMLAPSFNPPAAYGAVEFDGGGKYYFDFTDCKLDKLTVECPSRSVSGGSITTKNQGDFRILLESHPCEGGEING